MSRRRGRRESRARTFESKSGRCNICGEHAQLTDDHVPPQAATAQQKRSVRILTLPEHLDIERDTRVFSRRSQNGLKFRTLCRTCNGDLLGAKYDPELAAFSRDVGKIVSAEHLHLPPRIAVEVHLGRLARAVVGHLLAAEVREDMSNEPRGGPFVSAMRDYFLDEDAPWPKSMHLFFWPTPISWQAVFRGVGITRLFREPGCFTIGDFLKYWPVGFWLTCDADPAMALRGRRLIQLHPECEDSRRGSVLKLFSRQNDWHRADWPEALLEDECIFLTDTMCYLAEAEGVPPRRRTRGVNLLGLDPEALEE